MELDLHSHMYLHGGAQGQIFFILVVKGPAADATDALQPWGLFCNPMMKMKMIIVFWPFRSNGAPVEWNWQGKAEELGEKPVPVPLCPPQIPRRLTRDRTRASAVGGRRLTAWAMARPTRTALLFYFMNINVLKRQVYLISGAAAWR
jgi:hypothetical protein